MRGDNWKQLRAVWCSELITLCKDLGDWDLWQRSGTVRSHCGHHYVSSSDVARKSLIFTISSSVNCSDGMYRNVHVVHLPFPVLFLVHLFGKTRNLVRLALPDCRVAIPTAGVLHMWYLCRCYCCCKTHLAIGILNKCLNWIRWKKYIFLSPFD